jgi:hypothetical protein
MTFRDKWLLLLEEVCTHRVLQRRLKGILRELLYDGEDVQLRVSERGDPLGSPTLTPVERLLRLVGEAYGRLQEPLTDVLDDDSLEQEEQQKYFKENRKHPMNTTSPQGVDGRIVVA